MTTREFALEPLTQAKLMHLAWTVIESAVLRRAMPTPAELVKECEACPPLGVAMGAFVTIYVNGELRGCLGEVEPDDPLAEVVARCARRVPLNDYRFAAVTPGELSDLTFKVSVLSPPEPVGALEEIQLGTHGLLVRHAGHTGLLLPEVPLEFGWDLPTFLQHLWRKAGIRSTVAVDAVKLWRFTSQLLSSTTFLEGGGLDD